MHAGDDHVEPAEQLVGLVQRSVDVDVALDAGEDPERRELLVERGDDVQLLLEPLRGQPGGRRGRAGDSPLAAVSRGEWSVSAMYSWPRAIAASAISRIGDPPSDQSEWGCRSPRSAARNSATSSASGTSSANFSSRSARYSGTSPFAAWTTTV